MPQTLKLRTEGHPWALALLTFVFLLMGWAVLHGWPAEVFNYDLIRDYENASALVQSGQIPVSGSVASFGVFNPPGVSYGLVPGVILFPDDPVLGAKAATLFLSALTLAGIFILIRKRFGTGAAIWACLIYLLSANGWYFMGAMRPRAHPVFLIWTIYFCDLWIVDRKRWAVFPVLGLLAAGMYWMLEIAPLVVGVGALYLVYRPAVGWRWCLAGLALAGAIWAPYLSFEAGRDFKDARVLVLERESPHNFAKLFHSQRKEKGLARTMGHRNHAIPGLEPAAQLQSPSTGAPQGNPTYWDHLQNAFPKADLSQLTVLWLLLLGVSLAVPIVRWKRGEPGPGDRSYAVLLLPAILCWILLLYFSRGEAPRVQERRFLWMWALHGPLLVVAWTMMVDMLFPQARARALVKHLGLGLLLLGIGINSATRDSISSLIKHRMGTVPPGEFHQVIEIIAEAVDKHDLPPRIGYDIPFLAWIVSVRAIDGTSSIGIQYDLIFKHRYGIENLNTGPFSVDPADTFRIIEHASAQPWRQSYLDLSGYPPMELYRKLEDYTILVNPVYADRLDSE